MQNKLINILLFIPLIFLFLPAFYLPGTNVPCYDIIIILGLFVCGLIYKHKFIQMIIRLTKYKHFRMLLYFSIWIILIGIFFVTLGKYHLMHFLYATFILFLYNNLLWYLFPYLLSPKVFSLKFIIKFLYLGIYIVCIYGLLVYIFNLLGLPILEVVQNIINNRREEIVTARVISVFEEPSAMGGFLCINLPLLYTLSLSKFKIFKNKLLNLFIKKTYIPMLIITIICLQSPMWLIVFALVTCVYFIPQILRMLKKHFIRSCFVLTVVTVTLSISVFCSTFKSVDVSETFLNRIIKITQTMTNWDTLVMTDGSFANRLLSYRTRFRLWQDYPITGVGYKNAEYNIKDILINKTNVTFTMEVTNSLTQSYTNGGYIRINGAIFWILLSDTGIIGAILFYLFIIYGIKLLNKKIKYKNPSLLKDFVTGLNKTYISLICLSIYSININVVYLWFLLGLTNAILLTSRQYKTKELIINDNIK